MPNIAQRPYVGTWKLNNQLLVKHTPDCLVFVNGDLSIPGCNIQQSKVNIQPYIKTVSVDTSVEPGGHSATITLAIPRAFGESLFRDGRSVIKPTLEVHVYMRGYFPVRGLLDHLPDSPQTPPVLAGTDSVYSNPPPAFKNLPTYPYYHVFHGVVTQVNYEYADGFYSLSMACASMLHFWQYQVISTNGSAFGTRPRNSNVKMSLVGHNLSGMSPYGIIYMLYKDTAGAAAGVGFAMSSKTNTNAVSQVTGRSLYSMALLYWERRFKQTMYSLRMHGTNGRLFNGAQQAFLGSVRTADLKNLIGGSQFADMNRLHKSLDPFGKLHSETKKLRRKEILGRVAGQIGLTGQGFDVAYASMGREKGFSVNILDAQAYVSDISNWGSVNLWESEYETKLDIVNKVREVTGFEFYQDSDGDMVFKPPFYNMDTRASRVYRIEDIDLISINFAEKEPNATMVTMKGSQFKNLAGTGLDNEFGVRGQYIDYRMVAQFGWRPHNMDVSYFNDPRSMYYAAVNKLDLLNIDTNSAQCTIPIRPELRPGYPVYIPFVDSYYYITAFSHSLTFGSQCTTALTLMGRRSKFFAPGDITKTGVDKIRLDRPDLPPLPLQVMPPGEMVPRLAGFPNVVLALDPNKINPKFSILGGMSISDITDENEGIIDQIVEEVQDLLGASSEAEDFETARFKGPFLVKIDDLVVKEANFGDAVRAEFEAIQNLRTEISDANAIIMDAVATSKKDEHDIIEEQREKINSARKKIEAFATSDSGAVNALIMYYNTVVQNNDVQSRAQLKGDARQTAAYLDFLSDVKSNFVSDSIPGYYRYYSASHPEPEAQGMIQLQLEEASSTSGDPDTPNSNVAFSKSKRFADNARVRLVNPEQTTGFTKDASLATPSPGSVQPEAQFGPVKVTNGLMLAGDRGSTPRAVPTHLIQTISFASVVLSKASSFPGFKLDQNFDVPESAVTILQKTFQTLIYNFATRNAGNWESFSEDRLGDTFGAAYDFLNNSINRMVFRYTTSTGETVTRTIGRQMGSVQDDELDLPVAHTNTGEERSGVITSNTAVRPERLSDITIGEAVALAHASSNIDDKKTKFFTFGSKEAVKKYRLNLQGGPVAVEKTLNTKRRAQLLKVARYYGNHLARGVVENARFVLSEVSDDERGTVARQVNSILVTATGVPFTYSKRGKTFGYNKNVSKRIRRLTASYTPVFPVSDAQGYEVIGSYRYGRGIDIGPEGTMQKIYDQGNELVSDAFAGLVNASTAALFLETLQREGVQLQAEALFNAMMSGENLSGDDASEVAARLGITEAEVAKRRQLLLSRSAALAVVNSLSKSSDPRAEEALEAINNFQPAGNSDEAETLRNVDISSGAKAWINQFANSVATNQDSVFKLPVVNGAYALRDLADDLDYNARGNVTYRGAEADLLLEAFGRQEFITLLDVVEGKQPAAFLQEQMIRANANYVAAQKALRGQIMERSATDSLIDAWNRLAKGFDPAYWRGFRRQLEGSVDDVVTVAQRFRNLNRFNRNQVQRADDFDRLARI